MSTSQYLTYGLLTLMACVVFSLSRPMNVDWTKMPDPRSAGYQTAALMSLMFCVFAWPIVLVVLILYTAMGDRK